MRTCRWAAELAVAGDDARAQPGVDQLVALGELSYLGGEQGALLDAALAAVVDDTAALVDQARARCRGADRASAAEDEDE